MSKWPYTVVCLFALLVYNCGSPGQKTTGEKAGYFEYATPEEVGISSASLDQITDEIKKWVEDGDPVGAELLVMWMNKSQLDSKRYLSEASVKKALEHTLLSTKGAPGLGKGYGMHWSIYPGGKEGVLPRFGHSGSDGTLAGAIPVQK